MQALPRCRSLLISRNSLNFSSTQFASFHSTPIFNEKWKKKWNSKDEQKAYGANNWDTDSDEKPRNSTNKGRSKSDSRAQKIRNHRMRRKFRKGFASEDDDDHPEHIFQASFGNRWYSWSWAGTSHRSTPPGFDWRESYYNTRDHQKEWKTAYESDLEDEAFNVGSRSDRAVLGLPQNGPLKLKDVKTAFHSSALKWHPDKHQGSSQAAAEEKFKLCVNAYKSLSSALSGA
ncbi:uncharacterized protein LOC110682041 isoform X2 [Chenopodium quinoa]|uniref:uncharacterized protein LOC110682041 isoform X2 n=1 Tax=Chenopodium quinoa TaxID=63459 RepID=UPI000B772332|nr:uncharacterized protein LOC110682041 isoform X2 [Chenopodium quinoa]